MTDVAIKITLGQYMSKDILEPLVRKRLLGGYEVPVGPCIINVSTWLFQKGAVLGRARFDRLNVLLKLWVDPGREDDACSELRRVAKKRLDDFGREPDSFHTYWWETEFGTLDLTDLNVWKTLSAKKVRLEKIVPDLDYWLSSGIALGATYPHLVEKMWVKTYETPTPNKWALAREYGLDIPEEQTLLPLDDMEHIVLLEVGCYVSNYFPQFIEPLGLRIT